ncbi:MAG: hypothetical protein JW782_01655 [Candidatus Saganbacteria bacterium]|nr:hypothetical protein [Candidatus Saganbacteria bacterium]
MKNNRIINLIVLVFIFLFLLSFFEPRYLFSLTTTSGGDTVSHFPTAVHLKEVLLPQGLIMGWDRGNYAGYPLFYHYFPLTFIIMVLLSFVIPMQIAFKIGSVLGVFLLPVCIFFGLRALKYEFPVPVAGAVLSLPFLFMQANSMWGANIPSTLAGEYSYGLSMALLVLFFGTLYRGVEEQKWIIPNALLICLIGLSHGYTLIASGLIAVFFLFTRKDFARNIFYLFRTFGLALLLLAFWLVPFFFNTPYVTSYVTRWWIDSLFKVFPVILLPFWALTLISLFLNRRDRRSWYFLYFILTCIAIYFASPYIGMLDIRWQPFIQIFMTFFAATILLNIKDRVKGLQALPIMIFIAVLLWVVPQVTYIKGWIKWNYEGFEGKTVWPLWQQIVGHLKETGPGRVVYEHSPAHNVFGSERAFENLPYWARRDTLEGLYMQSSISAPFVFYIQSEVSKVCSGPFPQYKYTSLNLANALKRLKLFNVTQYIVRSEQAKEQAKKVPEFKLEKTFGDYQIYRLTTNNGAYVVPLAYEPVLFLSDNWKFPFHDWFKDNSDLDVHLVFIKEPDEADLKRFKFQTDSVKDLPKVPLKLSGKVLKEHYGDAEITFETGLIGQPHLIKVSYHPNWQVEGADKIYLVSPSFMLVYPKEKQVRLYFGKTLYNYVGELLTLAGLSIVIISGIIFIVNVRKT